MKKHDMFIMVLLAVVPLISLLCTGGSTEIGNARSVITGSITDNGSKVDSAEVQLVAEDYIPGGATADKVFTTLTDCRGNYRFEEVPMGHYYLNAKGAGKRLLRGPIEITQTEVDLATEELEETARLTISIPTGSEANVIFLQGTDRSWSIESDTVVLDSIPSGTIVVVAFSQSGAVPQNLSPENSETVSVDIKPAETAVAALDNAPPVIVTKDAELTRVIARTDSLYSITIRANDPEGGQLTFRLLTGPGGMSVDTRSGLVKWSFGVEVSAGDYPVIVSVSDEDGASRTIRWTVTVADQRLMISGTSGTASGIAGLTYLFEVDPTVADKANAFRFSWGDGDTTEWKAQPVASYRWERAGSYPVCFQVQFKFSGELSSWSEPRIINLFGDTVPPVITWLEYSASVVYNNNDTTIVLIRTGFVDNVVAWDAVDGNLTGRIKVSGMLDTSEAGTYDLTYSVSDKAGNTAVKRRTIVIMEWDTIPPVIYTGHDTIYVELGQGQSYIHDFSAEDNVDGSLTDKVIVTDPVDVNKAGTYVVTYTVSDAAGNTTTVQKIVIVLDTTGEPDTVRPVITLNGSGPDTTFLIDTVPAEIMVRLFKEKGYTAIDDCDGDITGEVEVKIESGTSSMTVTYSVRDAAGNFARTYRKWFLVDDFWGTTFDLADSDILIQIPVNGKWMEPGYAATDQSEGDVTSEVVVDSSDLVDNLSKPGTYYVVYSLTIHGQVLQRIRPVEVVEGNIVEPVPPVITLLGNLSDTVFLWMNPDETVYNDPGATAYDAKDGDITSKIVITGSVDINVPGSYSLTYFVRDADSNVTTVERFVWVRMWWNFPETLTKYGVPTGNPLPDVNTTYSTGESYGTGGPDLSQVVGLRFRWSQSENALHYLDLYTASGIDTLISLLDTSRQVLGIDPCALLVQGSGIDGLDGPYYVRVEGTTMYWVSFERDVVIVWKE